MEDQRDAPRRTKKSRRSGKVALLVAATMVSMCLLIAPSIGADRDGAPPRVAEVTQAPKPSPISTRPPVLTPTPAPTPTATPYHYGSPAEERPAVEMDYFSDAVFIGDSRTDGLRLYSGIKGTTFLCHKGLTVFDVMNRPDKRVVTLDGTKYTVLEALEKQQFGKVYISLGVNELGYNDNKGYEETFTAFLKKVRELQPQAVIYLQSLAPVNPEKCKANKQPYWVTNERVAAYNEIYTRLAERCNVVLVDVAAALGDGAGSLPAEGTVDGVHFTKKWYQKWLGYLTTHTVLPSDLGL